LKKKLEEKPKQEEPKVAQEDYSKNRFQPKGVPKPNMQRPAQSQNVEVDLSPIIQAQEDINDKFHSMQLQFETIRKQAEDAEHRSRIALTHDHFRSSLQGVLDRLHSLGGEISKLESSNNEIQRETKKIINEVIQIKSGLEDSSKQLEKSLLSNKEDVEGIVEKHTSTGFWTFFIIFQVLFLLLFVVYKRMNDDRNSKFF